MCSKSRDDMKRAKELTKYHKEPNFVDNFIKLTKYTFISVLSRMVLMAKKIIPHHEKSHTIEKIAN
jgi:hypothetical protein